MSRLAGLDQIRRRTIPRGRIRARELPSRAESIENAVYDLKAVNPHAKNTEDTRTPKELLDLIEANGREVAKKEWRNVGRGS